MNRGRHINKLALVRQHRETQYLYTLEKLINGQAKPADVTLRFKKLKAVKG